MVQMGYTRQTGSEDVIGIAGWTGASRITPTLIEAEIELVDIKGDRLRIRDRFLELRGWSGKLAGVMLGNMNLKRLGFGGYDGSHIRLADRSFNSRVILPEFRHLPVQVTGHSQKTTRPGAVQEFTAPVVEMAPAGSPGGGVTCVEICALEGDPAVNSIPNADAAVNADRDGGLLAARSTMQYRTVLPFKPGQFVFLNIGVKNSHRFALKGADFCRSLGDNILVSVGQDGVYNFTVVALTRVRSFPDCIDISAFAPTSRNAASLTGSKQPT
jgi:hypothetical protein